MENGVKIIYRCKLSKDKPWQNVSRSNEYHPDNIAQKELETLILMAHVDYLLGIYDGYGC